MKNILSRLIITTGLAFTLISFNANAGLMGTSEGTWHDPTGTAQHVDGVGTDWISWGTDNYRDDPGSRMDQSSWKFKSRPFEALTNGDWFKIGVFKHWNNPIYYGDFTGADLHLDLSIGDGSWMQSLTFGHEETLNWRNTCEYGDNPCADKVTLPYLNSTDTITIAGMQYELTIKGYSRSVDFDNGVLWTPENGHNYAKLYASLSKVPEPSIIALFGIGLLGLGFASRRKARG